MGKSPPAPFGAGGFSSPKIQWQPQPPLQPPQSRSKATRITPLPSASVISCCMALSLSRPARLSSANFLLFIKTPPQKYYFRRAAKKQSQKLQKLVKNLAGGFAQKNLPCGLRFAVEFVENAHKKIFLNICSAFSQKRLILFSIYIILYTDANAAWRQALI